MPRSRSSNSKKIPVKQILPSFLPRLSKRQIATFFLLVNTICWGLALVAVKPSLEFITPFRFLLYRYLVSAFLVIPVIWYYWPKIRNRFKTLGQITLIELLGTTLSLSLLYFGLNQTTAIEASILASTTPLFVVLAGVLLLKEKQTSRENLGLAIAFGSTLLLAAEPLFFGTGAASWSVKGNLLVLAANVCAALYYILAKKFYRTLPKLFVTAISFFVGSFSFWILVLAEQNYSNAQMFAQFQLDWQQPSVWIAVGYMAIFGSIIGLTAYIKGQDGIEASEASLFTYLQPLIAIPAGIVFLQESTTPLQIFALAAILVGVFIAEKRT
jgi:drug/metabolite transporter (DMT)-like permease